MTSKPRIDSSVKSRAPLFSDAFALCEWLLGRLGDDRRVLSEWLCHGALQMLEALQLALQDRSRAKRLAEADERLMSLRTQLRLAAAADYLSQSQMLHALQIADRIGKQIGGWQRHLEAIP